MWTDARNGLPAELRRRGHRCQRRGLKRRQQRLAVLSRQNAGLCRGCPAAPQCCSAAAQHSSSTALAATVNAGLPSARSQRHCLSRSNSCSSTGSAGGSAACGSRPARPTGAPFRGPARFACWAFAMPPPPLRGPLPPAPRPVDTSQQRPLGLPSSRSRSGRVICVSCTALAADETLVRAVGLPASVLRCPDRLIGQARTSPAGDRHKQAVRPARLELHRARPLGNRQQHPVALAQLTVARSPPRRFSLRRRRPAV